MNRIQSISEQILSDLITARKTDTPYYMKSNLSLILDSEDDLFITDEEILENIKKMLSDNYSIEITPVHKTFKSTDYEEFTYKDIELKLVGE